MREPLNLLQSLTRARSAAGPEPQQMKQPQAAGDFIAAGDRARDVRDWANAVEFYGKALDLNPKLAGIWVQYGHALKESGDLHSARNAYSRSLQLDPHNSDTALQMGHVLKISGDREAAARWYAKAVKGMPPQVAAWLELTNLGAAPATVRRVLNDKSDRTVHEAAVAWDSGSLSIASDSSMPSDLWRGRLLGALAPSFGYTIEAIRRPARGARWKAQDPQPGTIVVTPAPGEPIDEVVGAMDSAWLGGAVPIINLLGLTAWFNAGVSLNTAAIEELDQLISHAGGALVATALDAELVDSRARHLHLPIRATPLHLPPPRRVQTPAVSVTEKPFAVLVPPDKEAATRTLEALSKCTSPLIIVAEGGSSRALAEQAGLPIRRPQLSFDQLTAFAGLIVPADHPDGDAWIISALDAGVSVLVEWTPRWSILYGGSVAHARWSEPNAVASALRISQPSSPPSRAAAVARALQAAVRKRTLPSSSTRESARWGTAVARALQELVRQRSLTGAERATARLGDFLDMAVNGNGLKFCAGERRADARTHGCPFGLVPFNLAIPFRDICLTPWRVAMLIVASPSVDAISTTVSSQTRSLVERWSIVEEGWGWATVDILPEDLLGRSVLELSISIEPAHRASPGPEDAFIGGLIVYPVNQDHLWFEMLDLASRGRVGTLREVASHARAIRAR